jgi:ABC-type sugar transport system ATPase subunit
MMSGVELNADAPRMIDRAGIPALEVLDMSKSYGQVRALVEANIAVWPGEVVGLLGDNGAGKSTFVKCIVARTQPDSGSVIVGGERLQARSPEAARASGIEVVYQNLALVDSLDIAANLFLGREETVGQGLLGRIGLLARRRMRAEAARVLEEFGIDLGRVSLSDSVDRLSGGQRQGIAVARAVVWGQKVVMLDEPAAALGVEQTENVLALVRRLRDRGVGVVFISHNMDQVMAVCDRVVVMRRGRTIGSAETSAVTATDLVGFITGAQPLPDPDRAALEVPEEGS